MAHKAQVVVQPQPGLFEKISEALNLNVLSKKISANKHTLIDIGLFGAIGFIIGFLCKKYSEYVIMLAFFVAGLIVLNQFELIAISVNMIKLHQMLGVPYAPMMTGDAYLFLLWEWVKGHVPATISFVISFLIGLKVG